MKKTVIRVGDKVRIINPKFVRRVGYPLVWYDVTDEQLDADERCQKIAEAAGWPEPSELPRYLQIAVAKLYVEQRAFGGNERTIHYTDDVRIPFLNWECGPAEVVGKRVVKTGVRFAARYGVSSYDGEPWEEPGGLDDCKTHILLDLGSGYEIEACNVELLR